MVSSTVVVALVALGSLFLVHALFLAYQLRHTLQEGVVKQAWDLLSMFIILFIIGYTGYILHILLDIAPIDPQLLNALILFFAAVFVTITAYLSKKAFTE